MADGDYADDAGHWAINMSDGSITLVAAMICITIILCVGMLASRKG